jgi:starch synthase
MGDYPDNDRRFIFFQRAVIEALKKLNLKPDVLHCHDWQTGLIPAYLKTLYQGDPFFKRTKTFFTIHNPAHQGNFPPDSVSITGLSWEEFRYERLEFYGKISFLKGGLVYSDVLTTVSERYAQEIQTREFGCGMEGALLRRREDLFGILNGIDLNEWNPEKDPDIEANFSAKNLIGKQVCKEALQRENRLKVEPDIPLFGFVSRLAAQKGLDLMTSVIEEVARQKWQLVILGTGDEQYHKVLRILAKRHPDYIGLNITFDPRMAKRIFSGSDMFLMPSRFEPCGLGQMISLRFGTVPVVRETGGLRDTIQEFDPNTGTGNGFTFSKYEADDFFAAIERAVQVFRDRKEWAKLIRNGMGSDFSWKVSARRYVELYERAERKSLNV